MARPRAFGLTALVALLCVSACASDGGTAADGPTPTADTTPTSPSTTSQTDGPTTTTAPETTSPATSTRTTQAPDPVADGFVYVPWGPDDPPIPSEYAALAASAGSPPRCADAAANQPDSAFWDVAVAVCRAIAEGQPWPTTTTVPKPPPAPNAYQACLDGELAAMLQQALQFHARYPDRAPKVSFPSAATTSPCQRRIYEVRVLDASSSRDGKPDTVPVAITASALDQDPSVTIDGEATDVIENQEEEGSGLNTIVVLAPLTPDPRTAEIAVETYRGTLNAEVELPGAATTTESTVDPTGPTGTDSPSTEPTDGATERTTEPGTEPAPTTTSTP